jgi:hypothetical protein
VVAYSCRRAVVPMFPWGDRVVQATNAATLTEGVVAEFFNGDRLGEVILTVLRGDLAMVLATGFPVFHTWEKEKADELEHDMNAMIACTPSFWLDVEQHGRFLMRPNGTSEVDCMCKSFNELANNKVREFVKRTGRTILLSRLLAKFPEGVNTHNKPKQTNTATNPSWLWPMDAVDTLFERCSTPWMARHLACENVAHMTETERRESEELRSRVFKWGWRV